MSIAVATVVFAVVDGVLFKPLPFPKGEELYLVRADVSSGAGPLTSPLEHLPAVSSAEINDVD